MLLLLLACAARAPEPEPPTTPPPAPPESAEPPAPAPPTPGAGQPTLELLRTELELFGGDGEGVPLSVTWLAEGRVLPAPDRPVTTQELRWVVEGEGVRFVQRAPGPPGLLEPGDPPLEVGATRPLSLEEHRALRDAPWAVTLTLQWSGVGEPAQPLSVTHAVER